MSNVFTIDFGNSYDNIVGKKTPELAGGVFSLQEMKQAANGSNNKGYEFWLNARGYKFNMPWYNFNPTEFVSKRQGWYSCRIGMDPSKIGYKNDVEYQKEIVYSLIDDFSSEIKNLALIYEWGTNNKLHWHFLVNMSNIRKFRTSAKEKFGEVKIRLQDGRYKVLPSHCIYIKKVEPNNGETLEQNLKRILKYYDKEEQNKVNCLLTKNV